MDIGPIKRILTVRPEPVEVTPTAPHEPAPQQEPVYVEPVPA